MNKKTYTERELLEALNAESTHADELPRYFLTSSRHWNG